MYGKRLIDPGPVDDTAVATMPVKLELDHLRGKDGGEHSDLRPAGVADFDGKRVDVMSEGMLVPAGAMVRCIDVKAGRVLVRQTDRPGSPAVDLNNLDIPS